ncbi:MAG: hypothetical protein EXR80_06825 [Methylococcales bacterium]|nr:hypothetical protein [Methylococcales bacterium]
MNNCPSCGYERNKTDLRCPECGVFYPTIAELIAEEEAYEAAHSLRGRWQKIFESADKKHALLTELKHIVADLSTKVRFTLFVIFVFVFALIITVL